MTILVPETPVKDSKLKKLMEVFGSSRSEAALSKALQNANGELDLAIMYAAVEPPQEVKNDTVTQDEQPIKRRKLVKKKDLQMSSPVIVEPVLYFKDQVHVISDDETTVLTDDAQLEFQPRKRKLIKNKDLLSDPTSDDLEIKPTFDDLKVNTSDDLKVINITSDEAEEEDIQETESSEEEEEESTFEAATVLYFNSCAEEQLMETTGCSKDDAAFITSQRPFSSFTQLQDSLRIKRRYVAILDRYVEMMNGFAKVDQLIEETRAYGDDINNTLKKWGLTPENSSSGELSMIDMPKDDLKIEKTGLLFSQPDFIPKGLALKSYQLLGVSWLNLLYEKNLSGILADEMGLGKTAQVISFLGFLKSRGINGPHLIVAPSSTLENWAREIERWAPCLNFRVYYGSLSERGEAQYDIMEQAKDLNVVLTTYTMATGNKDDRIFLRKVGCTSIILDEGHMIKNMESARYKYLSMYKAKFRLLMTGTPLQNNLMELLSLLTFIMPDLFSEERDVLSKIFAHKKATTSTADNLLCKQRVVRAKEMMTPFVLRRRKDQVLKELPKKIISIQKCHQTPHQKAVYDMLFAESRRDYLESENLKNDTKGSSKKPPFSSKALNNYIMEFRKVANHPLLRRYYYTNDILSTMSKKIMKEPEYCDANSGYIYEDMQFMSDFELHQLCKKFKSIHSYKLCDNEWMDSGKVKQLSKILPEMISKGDRVLIFSQFVIMLDILEEVMETLGISYLRLDGSTHVNERQGLIDEFNDNSKISVFLISTKAGGVGINLTSANVVIIYDMDFNPHNDKQAEDRAHRVGQLRDVNVLKLVTLGSIEEHILRSAERKIKLDEKIRDNDERDDENEWLDETVMEALRNELRET